MMNWFLILNIFWPLTIGYSWYSESKWVDGIKPHGEDSNSGRHARWLGANHRGQQIRDFHFALASRGPPGLPIVQRVVEIPQEGALVLVVYLTAMRHVTRELKIRNKLGKIKNKDSKRKFEPFTSCWSPQNCKCTICIMHCDAEKKICKKRLGLAEHDEPSTCLIIMHECNKLRDQKELEILWSEQNFKTGQEAFYVLYIAIIVCMQIATAITSMSSAGWHLVIGQRCLRHRVVARLGSVANTWRRFPSDFGDDPWNFPSRFPVFCVCFLIFSFVHLRNRVMIPYCPTHHAKKQIVCLNIQKLESNIFFRIYI